MWKRTTESRQRAGEADANTVYARALALLKRREHALAELRRKLSAAGFPAALVDGALTRLTSEGYLSNARYAEALARARLNQGHGPVRIRADLRHQGLQSEEIENALAALDPDWLAQAQAARKARFGAALPGSYADRVKQARFLAQRGFPPETIRRCTDTEED